MEFKKADLTHLDEITEIWKDFFDFHQALNPFFTRSDQAENIFRSFIFSEMKNENSLLAVALKQNKVMGYVLARINFYPPVFKNPLYCQITDIVLVEKERGKGEGKKLFEQVVFWCREKNISRIELQVLPQNTKAWSFYQKLGFKEFLSTLAFTI
ncbi:MAG TPA: hypothetical protein DHW82_12915 [Spirochaetia bacterium]|nr:MAG: hypothetical protein A2Y41_12765 [Spirochaetes bacterium GWB1_36_13]HCL57891.1 hypothetical protein [Spirochaetia bacterium]